MCFYYVKSSVESRGGWAIAGLNSSGNLRECEVFSLRVICERLGFKENFE